MELLISLAIIAVFFAFVHHWDKKSQREMAARRSQYPKATVKGTIRYSDLDNELSNFL